jgi:hypothetical protein
MNGLSKSLLLVLLLAYCEIVPTVAKSAEADVPLKVSVCDILQNPAAYNHKVVEVSGKVTRGFEGFTLSDGCNISSAEIWLELGGTVGAQVMYCCGVTTNPQRKEPLVVDGIPTTLAQDAEFQKFQQLTLIKAGYGEAHATLIGRFFSGKKRTFPGGARWAGYGHMGFFSLLVIQQVVAVSKL